MIPSFCSRPDVSGWRTVGSGGATGSTRGSASVPARVPGPASAAAAVSARPASAVPEPEPLPVLPPGWNTVPLSSASVTWAGVRLGNWDSIRAAIPATMALAALVLFMAA